jgi:hypothetical protein
LKGFGATRQSIDSASWRRFSQEASAHGVALEVFPRLILDEIRPTDRSSHEIARKGRESGVKFLKERISPVPEALIAGSRNPVGQGPLGDIEGVQGVPAGLLERILGQDVVEQRESGLEVVDEAAAIGKHARIDHDGRLRIARDRVRSPLAALQARGYGGPSAPEQLAHERSEPRSIGEHIAHVRQ